MFYRRFIIGFILLLILLLSMVYSYQNHEKNDPHIQILTHLFEHPEQFNNTEVSFFAQILAIDRENNTIRIFIEEKPFTYPPVTIDTGTVQIQHLHTKDFIDLIAIHHGTYTFTATNIWLIEPWKTLLIYLRSLPAIPLVLYLFLTTWKWNRATGWFERRTKHA